MQVQCQFAQAMYTIEMLHKHTYKNLTWIDLETPTVEEVRQITLDFDIDPVVANELLFPTLRPHTERYENHLYLVLHFPTVHKEDSSIINPEQEVDFIIGRDFIITTHYEELETFMEFRKIFELNTVLSEGHLTDNPFDIFLLLTDRLYKTVDLEIDSIRSTLEYIEGGIFSGKEHEMVVAISRAGRDILNLKQALDPHQDILSSLQSLTTEFIGKEYVARVQLIENKYYRSRKHVTSIWQTLIELRETNNSLLTTKQNEVMKIFTILAFVTFPLSLFASIFGMNTVHTPFIGDPYDFWIVIGMMGVATFFMFLFFKHKHWL